jgi:hypothetical protein
MEGETAVKTQDRVEGVSFTKGQAEEWRTRPALTLLVDNIPKHWMIGELKTFLDGFGTVVKVEIFEDRAVLFPTGLHNLILYRLVKTTAMEK